MTLDGLMDSLMAHEQKMKEKSEIKRKLFKVRLASRKRLKMQKKGEIRVNKV